MRLGLALMCMPGSPVAVLVRTGRDQQALVGDDGAATLALRCKLHRVHLDIADLGIVCRHRQSARSLRQNAMLFGLGGEDALQTDIISLWLKRLLAGSGCDELIATRWQMCDGLETSVDGVAHGTGAALDVRCLRTEQFAFVL